MRKIFIIFVSCVLIISTSCGKKKEKSKEEVKIEKEAKETVIPSQKETVKPSEKPEYKEIPAEVKSKKEFFKGGIITKGAEYYGVYIVEQGDSVWVIAKKYAKYLKGNNYTKTDVGNIAYWINRVNYSHFFGGVKDRLKIGEEVLVPISKIDKALKE